VNAGLWAARPRADEGGVSGFRFGMASDAGEQAVATVVARLRGADLVTLAGELPGAVALIACVHPEVRSELVGHTIADALGLSGS
jgi:hypothetical protein